MFNSLFLFSDFQCFDRQADTAVALVEIGHHRIKLVANMETLGALVLAVARQVGTADKGRHIAIADRYFQATIGHRGHFACHRIATAQIGDALKRVTIKLFNAQADAFFFLIDVKHNRFHALAPIILRQSFIARSIPIEVGNMHHAVNLIIETDKQAKLGDVFNLAFDFRANREFRGEILPRIFHTLFQAQRNTPLIGINFQHHDFDFLAG